MKHYKHRLAWRALVVGLIVFFIAFGLPFVSLYTSGKILTLAGCSTSGFDQAAHCPEGVHFAARFILLNNWAVSLLFWTPVVFIQQFWDVLLVWIGLIVYFGRMSERN